MAKRSATKKPGLYANIHAKKLRIKAGSGERMRKPGSKGAPTAKAFKDSAKTAKKPQKQEYWKGMPPAALYSKKARRRALSSATTAGFAAATFSLSKASYEVELSPACE
jgi:hypothetical protein